MSRFNPIVRRLRIIRASLEQQATRLRLPFYIVYRQIPREGPGPHPPAGETDPAHLEAEAEARRLGVHLKEYGFDPSEEGVDP